LAGVRCKEIEILNAPDCRAQAGLFRDIVPSLPHKAYNNLFFRHAIGSELKHEPDVPQPCERSRAGPAPAGRPRRLATDRPVGDGGPARSGDGSDCGFLAWLDALGGPADAAGA